VAELAATTSAGFRLLTAGASEMVANFEIMSVGLGKPQDRLQAPYGQIND
jgi:hypothetical protein